MADDSSAPHVSHRRAAPASLGFAVLTVSDTRTGESDRSGDRIRDLGLAAGWRLLARDLVPDETDRVTAAVRTLAATPGADVVLVNGGTGIATRDRTVEAVGSLLDRTLPGFGELFRALSFREIGAAAMASRALAGLSGGVLVFCMPGSTGAVSLAMEHLIVPEAPHLVGQIRKDGDARP